MRLIKSMRSGVLLIALAVLAGCGGGDGGGGDEPVSPAPASGVPAGLWRPAPGATPASGNYVYLESGSGDFIGAGRTYSYTQADAVLSVTTDSDRHLSVRVTGDQWWQGDFQAMNSIVRFEPGYYGDLARYPLSDPSKGGLDWYGDGRGCNSLSGWFLVDSVSYQDGRLVSIELRFEQFCDRFPAPLHGKVRWAEGDSTVPPGPVSPPPSGLWEPPAGSTPVSGSYAYLVSDAGDFIGQGQTYLYTPGNAVLSVQDATTRLHLEVSGAEAWSADFQTMNSIPALQVGYYGGLMRFPFHNPAKGGLDWYGQGSGCNKLSGWFVIDSLSRVNGVLDAIDLRFEQHCEGLAPALHGKIHWVNGS